MTSWALPMLGVVTMFSLAVFFVVRRRAGTSTRQLRLPEEELVCEEDGDSEGLLFE
jgi:hypothetical protein